MMNLDVMTGVTLPRLTSQTRLRGWVATLGIGSLLLASLASAVTATGTIVADDASATPKVYHVLLGVAGVAVLLRGSLPRPRIELVLYFGVMIVATLFAYLAYEPRVGALKLLIALYVALVASTVGRLTSREVVLKGCQFASVAFLAIVTVKNIQHAPGFALFLANPLGHPDVPSLAGGGLNLEATWLALVAVFLIGTAFFTPFVLVAAATSALYASRAGVVVATLAAGVAVAHAWTARGARGRELGPSTPRRRFRTALVIAVALIAVAALGAAITAARQLGDATYVASRFSAIGDEPGSLGRVTLWRGGLAVFAEHPFGVGLGNAVPALRRTLGVDVPEDNLHNIYLQHAVEAGLPGLVALMALGVMVARRVVRSRFRDRLTLFVAGYFVAGAIQFTGVDAILWLVYGLQSGLARESADA